MSIDFWRLPWRLDVYLHLGRRGTWLCGACRYNRKGNPRYPAGTSVRRAPLLLRDSSPRLTGLAFGRIHSV